MKSKLLAAVIGLAAFTVTSSASAVVITFEGTNNTIYNVPITRSGFDIGNPLGQLQHFHEITSTGFGLPNNGTGVLLNDRDTEIFIEVNGGGSFSLASVDVGSALNNNAAIDLQIEGFLNNVSTGTILIQPLGNGYTVVAGGSLGTVDRLIFDGLGGAGGFVLDNLNVTAGAQVPEPGTLAILGLGLVGLGLARRKRAA